MTTIQPDEAQHSEGDHRRGCCGGSSREGSDGCGSHGNAEDTAVARRGALEERQRDLEQELSDVAEQLRDLPTEQPSASE
ncbi:MAG: hypothetical protein QOJ56_5448 [Mycobacterium sp.]|jgi:hypothetical protein|nr:hypothetical protein [Mycobacterium sp.]